MLILVIEGYLLPGLAALHPEDRIAVPPTKALSILLSNGDEQPSLTSLGRRREKASSETQLSEGQQLAKREIAEACSVEFPRIREA